MALLRAVLCALLTCMLAGGAAGAQAPAPDSPPGAMAPIQVFVDTPADGATVGPDVTVRGWAAGAAGAAGVDRVMVYAGGDDDGDRGQLLGAATYGLPRPDVAALLGAFILDNVGYALPLSLAPGDYRLAVYAHAAGAAEGEGWSAPAVVAVTVSTAAAPPPSAGGDSPPQLPNPGGSLSGGGAVPSGGAGVRPGPGAASVAPGVTGGAVCTNRGPGGTCLAYTTANGGVGMVCSQQTADGECAAWAQSYSVNTACARYGEGGQCLTFGTSPAANPPPGGAAQTTAYCLEYNANGQCNRYSGQTAPEATTIRLTAQQAGTAVSLNWSVLPGATIYELLRCPNAQLGNCSTVAQSGATIYTLATRQNYWYAVRARGADGQVLATSNLLGPL